MHKTDAGIVKIPASVLHCLFLKESDFAKNQKRISVQE